MENSTVLSRGCGNRGLLRKSSVIVRIKSRTMSRSERDMTLFETGENRKMKIVTEQKKVS